MFYKYGSVTLFSAASKDQYERLVGGDCVSSEKNERFSRNTELRRKIVGSNQLQGLVFRLQEGHGLNQWLLFWFVATVPAFRPWPEKTFSQYSCKVGIF